MVAWHEITEEVWRILGRTGEPDCMGFGAEWAGVEGSEGKL